MAPGLALKEPPGFRTAWVHGAIVGQSPGTQHHGTGFQQYSRAVRPTAHTEGCGGTSLFKERQCWDQGPGSASMWVLSLEECSLARQSPRGWVA